MFSKFLGYVALYGAHALKVFSFILLIPYFTRIFPKTTWGEILIVQSLALWLQILVEYGFNLSATRAMARIRDNEEELARLVAGVAGAKAFLAAIAALLSVICVLFLNSFHNLGYLVFWGTIFAITQGFNPVWYFLAREKFGQYASIDFISRLSYLILCILLIKNSNQGELIFIIGIITGTLANLAGYIIISCQIPLRPPAWRDSEQALRNGFTMFVFVGITSIYTTLNVIILGFSQTTAIVAAYGTSDRIVRAAGGLLDPLNRIIYAKLSYLYHHDFDAAIAFLKRAGTLIFSVGLVIFATGQIFSGFFIELFIPNYPEALEYIKILLLFIPILALNNIAGLHIMLPMQMDRQFNLVFVTVSLLSLFFMLLMTPRFGAGGMAIITVITELGAFLGMLIVIIRKGVLIVRGDRDT